MISNNIICQAFPSESDASASLSHFSPFLLNLGRCILPSPTFKFWSQTFFFFLIIRTQSTGLLIYIKVLVIVITAKQSLHSHLFSFYSQ